MLLRKYLLHIAVFIIVLVATASSVQTSISVAEQQLAAIREQLTALRDASEKTAKQADSLAALISQLKQKEDLGFFDKRRLDGFLKDAQRIAAEQEKINAQRADLLRQKAQTEAALESLYTAAMDSLLGYISSHPEINGTEKSRLGEEMRLLNAKRQQLHALEKVVSDTAELPSLGIEIDDTPNEIEAKADFYRDREDRYREKAEELQGHIKKVRDETTLRKRMAELVDDTRLFDHRDEPFATKTTVAGAPATDEGTKGWGPALTNEYSESRNAPAMTAADQLLTFDFQSLPIYDVDDYLKILEAEKQRLVVTADSIAAVAKIFDEQAKQLRQSIERTPK